MKNIAFLIFSIILLSSCGFIETNIETDYKVRTAHKYPDQIAITKEELKHKLINDTLHYKIVILYKPGCDGCESLFSEAIPKMWNSTDTSKIKWYFIQSDCGTLKWNRKFLEKNGIKTTMYYFKSNKEKDFSPFNSSKFNNLANYLFESQSTDFDNLGGIPANFIVDKKGRVKIQLSKYSDGTLRQGTLCINMLDDAVENINFSKADTTFCNYNDDMPEIPVCSDHRCK